MTSSPSRNNRTQQETADQNLIDGLNKHSATITTLVIGGKSLTPAAIITTLQARIATAKTAQSTRATWQAAVAADKAERSSTKTFVSGVRQAIAVAFAGAIDELADFGLTPRKQAVITPETRVAAAAKAKATRKARNTLGPKQKLAIKGTVPPTPTTAPSASTPTAPATPAPATPVTTPVATPSTPAPAPASGSTATTHA